MGDAKGGYRYFAAGALLVASGVLASMFLTSRREPAAEPLPICAEPSSWAKIEDLGYCLNQRIEQNGDALIWECEKSPEQTRCAVVWPS